MGPFAAMMIMQGVSAVINHQGQQAAAAARNAAIYKQKLAIRDRLKAQYSSARQGFADSDIARINIGDAITTPRIVREIGETGEKETYEAAKNILGIAEAVNSVSIPKAVATTGVLAAAAVASTAKAALEVAGGLPRAAGGGEGAGGGSTVIEQPVELKINGDVLEKFIIQVTGDNIKKIRLLQS